MIRPEDVADLQPGDVVEYRDSRFPDVVTRGPVRYLTGDKGLALGANVLLAYSRDGLPPEDEGEHGTLTVVSRAPRPLYVNHDRTEPLMNDVARSVSEGDTHRVWIFDGFDWWFPNGDTVVMVTTEDMPRPMRLLVDGETGRCVP